jgi:hypothetical protein
MMMEAARTSETSVENYFTRQYIPEDNSELHTRRRENLKSHNKFFNPLCFKYAFNFSTYMLASRKSCCKATSEHFNNYSFPCVAKQGRQTTRLLVQLTFWNVFLSVYSMFRVLIIEVYTVFFPCF